MYVDAQLNWTVLISLQLIREYMYGKVRRPSKKSAFQTPRWSYLDVVTTMNRRKINKLALKLSQSRAGSPRYLSNYGRARAKVERQLTETQRRKYKAMAKEWGKHRLPRKAQQQYVHGNDSSRL
jgi:hypothetical protein